MSGLSTPSLRFVEHDGAADTTQSAERLLMQFGPRARAGLEGEQANGLAAVAQREYEQACAPVSASVGIAHHRPAAIVDLRFLSGSRDDNRTRRLGRLAAQPADEAFDAGVAPGETMGVDQI